MPATDSFRIWPYLEYFKNLSFCYGKLQTYAETEG